jgi:hypothetical protein
MDKKVFYLAGSLGSAIGGYVPTLLGTEGFSAWSVLGGLVGGVGAIVIVYRMSR